MTTITNERSAKRIIKARTGLLLSHFFWGRLALNLRMVEDKTVPTLEVDGTHIFYNPDFIETLNDRLVMSAMVHEIEHCMFEHIFRRNGREPDRWNRACDYIVNADLKKAGFDIGKGWLYDPQYDGMYAEEVYDLLQQQEGQGGGSSGGNTPAPAAPLCNIRDGATSAADKETKELEWKVAVSQAATEAKQRGCMPAHMERFVEEMLAPKVNWRDVLQRFVSTLAKDDYSWARANRRFVAHNLFLPSLRSESMGKLTVVVDTSGSITQPILDTFASEIQAIAHMVRPEVINVIYCDAEINHVVDFPRGEDIVLEMKGGGGTDFRPPFKHVDDTGEPPVALIYLTDLYGPAPASPPDYPVLWCCTTDKVGPWGETVFVDV